MRFHIEYLLFGISRIADKDQVSNFGHLICLLIFWCNPQGCNPHQLKLVTLNDNFLKVGINYVDVDEQCHRLQLILQMHIHQPVHQYCSHVLRDIGLILEITRLHSFVFPQLRQVLDDLLQILILFFSFSFYGLSFHRTIHHRRIMLRPRLVRCRWHVFPLFLRCRALWMSWAMALLHKFHINYL